MRTTYAHQGGEGAIDGAAGAEAHIDQDRWPGIAQLPQLHFATSRTKREEARFASACRRAGIELAGQNPDITIESDALFLRIADAGWLGLMESFMAGEWRAKDLTTVLMGLIKVGYEPTKITLAGLKLRRASHLNPSEELASIPPELMKHSAADGMSIFSAVFQSGVSTTVREAVDSYVRGAGKGREPARHFVDVTEIVAPVNVEREDLGAAQVHGIEMLLEAGDVGAGTHLMVYPTVGGAVAMAASRKKATVDTFTLDPEMALAVEERLTFAGLSDAVHIINPTDIPQRWAGGSRYDAVISIGTLDTLYPAAKKRVLKDIDHMLVAGAKAVLQTDIVKAPGQATDAIASLRAYMWPGLSYLEMADIHRMVDRNTSLRVIAETHIGAHQADSLKLRRAIFEGNLREAAADGFDVAYRRLWRYQFALREALLRCGILDTVQLTLRTRRR